MQNENRLFKRYRVPDDALYIFCKDSHVKGWVRDISSDGMGIGYFSVRKGLRKQAFKLILASDQSSIYLPDIACKIVYDREDSYRTGNITSSMVRHCGVQFGKLTAETRTKLQGIMQDVQPLETRQQQQKTDSSSP